MAEEERSFMLDILKSYDLDSLILAFCLSMLVGFLIGALIYIFLTWLSRRRATAQITRRTHNSSTRGAPHGLSGVFRHSGSAFGFYRETALDPSESPGHKPLFRATPYHPPLLIDSIRPQVEEAGGDPPVSPSANGPKSTRVPPVRLSSFRSELDKPRGPRAVQTPPPPYESVLLAFEEAGAVPQTRIMGS
ncbi:hypothetical protein GJAV_G00022090 [Gymnothorax javanicus]|nr:hypothetical protein GJAV_G00022090 [Gymnothorax javanicus]